jgi:hypothetical protein
MWHARERRENVKVSGVKAQRKETTRKTEASMGGWDQNGS